MIYVEPLKVCGEECGFPSVLKRHMRKHDESLRLPCGDCDKKFMSRQAFIFGDSFKLVWY